jgi:calcineurin-like phosphoesterase family protein
MYFFTADEHYGHAKVIQYCNRPFRDVSEMNHTIISNHNAVVTPQDITVHAGDFCWHKKTDVEKIIRKLNGSHIFIKGSHDAWMPSSTKFMWRKMINGNFIVVCHYAMRTWERAHHGSWQLYGHSHNKLAPIGFQHDVGVDGHNFYPYSEIEIAEIMKHKTRETGK